MKFTFTITKKNLAYTAVIVLLSVLARIFSGISIFNTVMFILLFFAVKNLQAEWNEKLNGWLTAAAIAAGSIVTTWLVQYLLLVEDLRERISEETFFLNICCTFVVYLLVQACTNHAGLTCILSHSILMVFAGANYFVYEFRGNELTFADLKTVSTGLSVAANYRFSLNAQAMNAILLSA